MALTAAQHTHSSHNLEEIRQSVRCGCFYCQRTFPADSVIRWVGKNVDTAACPYCGIDSVLGDAAVELSEDLLQTMHREWFETIAVRGPAMRKKK